MFVRRLINRHAVTSLEMAAACTPVAAGKEKPLTVAVCGPMGREVVGSGYTVAEVETTAGRVLNRHAELFGAVIEYTPTDGKTVVVSRITPDD